MVSGLVEGRASLISGAGSGIGRATARLLAEHGARVVLMDLNAAAAEDAAAQIRHAGADATAIPGDAADEADVARVVRAAVDALGGLSLLINNAGIAGGPRATSDELSLERWDEMLRVNFRGYLLMSRAALPWLIEARGAVVNTASSVALSSAPGSAHYTTAKAAVVSLTRHMAAELGPRGVRVNSVAPGIINTGFGRPADRRDVVDPVLRARHERYIPLGREGTAEDVAKVILFLCSDLAGYVTGQNILIDGGLLDMVYPMVNDTAG
ncbi:MAG: SDR family oxidoreductase [Chloroflexi bacterium]|nr:SDR family oxidoreductase [Chloroflexota bacterium]